MKPQCMASGTDAQGEWTCRRPRSARGYCVAHYHQFQQRRPIKRLKPKRSHKGYLHDPNDMFCVIPKGHRRCLDCHEIKPYSEFHKATRRADGINTYCKRCATLRDKDKLYGKGAAKWFLEQFERQGRKCGRCGAKTTTGWDWAFDHCHKTGRWRDVLCLHCNRAIGQMETGWDAKAFMASLENNPL